MRSAAHALFLLLLSSLAVGQCIPAPGTAITVGMDTITGPNPIGFAFPFAGATFADIHISDHGICFLTNGGIPAPPSPTALPVWSPAAASLVANGPVICPLWADSIPSPTSMFFIDAQPTVCTVSWIDVQSFGLPVPLFSFQLKLYLNGTIEFRYGPNVTNNSNYGSPSDHAVVGVSDGAPAVLPAAVDFSSGPTSPGGTIFEEFLVANSFDMAGDKVRLQPGSPGGWTVTHTANGACGASASVLGVGCEGLTLSSNLPVRGTDWDLMTTGFHPVAQFGFTFFTLGPPTSPTSLTSLGFPAPGCDANINLGAILNGLVGAVTPNGSLVTVAIPGGPGFFRLRLIAQTVALTTANAAGLATSNAIVGRVGN